MMLATANVANCVGPIIGGSIAAKTGSFIWVFRALAIFGATLLFAILLLLPETARNVVGNGAIQDHDWNTPVLRLVLRSRSNPVCSGTIGNVDSVHTNADPAYTESIEQPNRSFHITSPLGVLKILGHKDALFTIFVQAIYYGSGWCISAAIPTIFSSPPYSFTGTQIGLAYVPFAIGVILSMYISGALIDYNYRKNNSLGLPVDMVNNHDLTNFPIEDTRLQGTHIPCLLCTAIMLGYGWSIKAQAHVAVPLVLQALFAFLSNFLVQSSSVLLLDVFPETPSIATTAGSMTRCVFAAALIAILEPFVGVVSHGWFFTVLGVRSGLLGLVSIVTIKKYGIKWRLLRKEAQKTAV